MNAATQGAEDPATRGPAASASPLVPWTLRLLVLAIATTIVFLRRPDQFTNPQLWAEDGIFFFQARTAGLRAFTLELAGYFHLAPRTIAGLANLLDPAFVPHVFFGATLALTLYVMSRIMSARCPLPFRPACALALVLVPDAAEVLLNTNNLQWVFVAGWIALLISAEPTRLAQRIHDFATALFFGLTSPFSVVMTPFFAWRAFTRRTPASVALAAIVAACALLQVVSILRHPQPPPPNPIFDPAAAFAFPGLRVAGSLLFSPWLLHPPPFAIATLLTLGVCAGIGFLAFRPGDQRPVRVVLGLAFFASLASTVYRCWHSMPVLCVPNNATRYVYPLQVFAVWLLLAHVRDRSRLVRFGCIALLLVSLTVNIRRLRIAPVPDKQWSLYAPKLRAGEEVTVPINPDGWNFPFPARPPKP